MNKNFSRIVAIVLVVLTVICTLSTVSIAWDQVSYWSRASKFYPSDKDDIASVAEAQKNRPASDFKYPGAWCAAFVSDCAIKAGVTSVIPYDATCETLLRKVKSAGGTEVNEPQRGDLVFYWCTTYNRWCHVAIMRDSINTVQGNCGRKVSLIKYYDYQDTAGRCYTTIFVRPNYRKTVQVEQSCDMYKQVAVEGAIHRQSPINTATIVGRFAKGKIIHVKAQKYNSRGNLWYKLDDNSWIYHERVTNPTVYKVKYDANGGSGVPATQTKSPGKALKLSAGVPTKKWNRFVAWNDTVNKSSFMPGDNYKYNRSTTMKAVWKSSLTNIKLSSYNEEICLNGDNTAKLKVIISGYLPLKCKILNDTGADKGVYSFVGENISDWKLENIGALSATVTLKGLKVGDDICRICIIDSKGKVLASATVYVTVTQKYKVNYNANGGTGAPAAQTKVSNKNLTLSDTIPKMSGYTFMGWGTSSGATTPEYGPGDLITNQITADTTLYAIWKRDYQISNSWDEASKTLTISGYGDMAYYSRSTPAPWAQYKNQALKIVIGEGITSVGSFAFNGFTKVTQVDTPSTLKTIYAHAFSNCWSLNEISIPQGTVIKSYAFSDCASLKNVKKTKKKKVAARISAKATAVEDESMRIDAFAFSGCESLETLDLSNVTSIGQGAFSGCTSLDNIVIPETITTIEDTAFFNCESLKEIEIPNSVTEISDGAFQGCTSIEEIVIPESVTELGDQVYSGCTSVQSVSIPETVETIGDGLFANCTSLSEAELSENAQYIGNAMFSGCTSLETVEIPENVTDIGNGTFLGCTSLKSIEIPDEVEKIGSSVFLGCTSLEGFSMNDRITEIGDYAFSDCTSLKSVEYSDNVTEIGNGAFANCTSLESVTLPEAIETLGLNAFESCTSLKNVEFAGNSTVTIKDEAFAGCTALGNVYIPENAVSVSNTAFSSCSSLMSVTCYSTADVASEIASSGVNCNVIYHPTAINLDKTEATLNRGEKKKLNVSFVPTNAENQNVIWLSDNDEVATVSSDGTVTAVGSGTATITAISEDGAFEASCNVHCVIPVESVTIDNKIDQLYVGSVFNLYYTLNPESPTNLNLKWKSSDNSVLTVSDDGVITALKKGLATVSVTSEDGGKTDSFIISVNEYIPVENVEVESLSYQLHVNEQVVVKAKIVPEDATDNMLYFYSDDDTIASIDEF